MRSLAMDVAGMAKYDLATVAISGNLALLADHQLNEFESSGSFGSSM
jgi:putative cofactor-binding repeat protein